MWGRDEFEPVQFRDAAHESLARDGDPRDERPPTCPAEVPYSEEMPPGKNRGIAVECHRTVFELKPMPTTQRRLAGTEQIRSSPCRRAYLTGQRHNRRARSREVHSAADREAAALALPVA